MQTCKGEEGGTQERERKLRSQSHGVIERDITTGQEEG